ncbi:hypothetical protein A7K91_04915 [Paenibacillus oryzae]|uniref:LamG-like jellyroll fold domain-containing protein n=1 Tax=Paenibacillus oryzae TaxID=1844972 RepID=A0A1A5YH74_9BACL|nr:LamG-like jellyroll fold domain-containing protein [Paenibacillus oryzae]OBR64924.1 hypothetical protein A7K91_04915 [Paenibacillus oryzae]
MASTAINMDRYGVAWFKMDEASGNLIDSKGAFVGTNTGTTIVPGTSGNARNFNGINNVVQFNGRVIPVGKKSVRFRIKTNQISPAGDYAFVLDTRGTNLTTGGGLVCFVYQGNLYFGMIFATQAVYVSHLNISDNLWHDVLFTWDGTSNLNGLKLYVDDLITPKAMNTKSFPGEIHTVNLRLGWGGYPYYFRGQLDELEIYNDVITTQPDRSLIHKNGSYLTFFPEYMEWRSVGASLTKSILDQYGEDSLEEWTRDVFSHAFNSIASYSSGAGTVLVTPVTTVIPAKSIHVQ